MPQEIIDEWFTISFVRVAPKSPDYQVMERVLRSLQNHSSAWPFAKPVRIEEVADYFDVVKHPMGTFMASEGLMQLTSYA